MARHAIIIGIDQYANRDWNLNGAVKDALTFRDWAISAGSVEPQNVRLLLSTGDAEAKKLATAEATRANITQAIQDYQDGAGEGAERLYFYYAGHGLSAPGVMKEPVIVPADVTSLKRDSALLIGFSAIMPCFVDHEPYEQFFFIDACRDFGLEDYAPPIGGVGPWTPSSTNQRRSSQHLLYATSPGQKAFETSIGVFTSVLMDGLTARGVELEYVQPNFRVRFPKLATFVIDTVEETVRRKKLQNAAQFVQVPMQQVLGDSPDPILVEVHEANVPDCELTVRVFPTAALEKCRVSANVYFPRQPKPFEIKGEGPPIRLPLKLGLPPQNYAISAVADDYDAVTAACSLFRKSEIELTLNPRAVPAAAPVRRMRGVTRKPKAAPTTDGKGLLELQSDDELAELIVRDLEGKEILRDRRSLSTRLEPGLYRVQLEIAGRLRAEELVTVQANSETKRKLAPPLPAFGKAQQKWLRDLGILRDDSGYLYASDTYGIADARLASLLALAAFAHSKEEASPELAFLQNVAIDVPQQSPAIVAIVGASGDAPRPGMKPDDFVNQTSLTLLDEQHRFETLPQCPFAAQLAIPVRPGSATIRLELPGLEPTHYAVACLPGRITVFIVVVNDDGSIDTQQYIIPAADAPPGPYPWLTELKLENLRRIEIAQRSYSRTAGVPSKATEMLLWGKWLDPLMACVAGYALLRRGEHNEFETAARNILAHYPELPDAHVLAAMQWQEEKDARFAEAARLGTPVFAEGFRALQQWREGKNDVQPEALEIARGLLPTSPWTAWVLTPR
jgi:hypothetical protein